MQFRRGVGRPARSKSTLCVCVCVCVCVWHADGAVRGGGARPAVARGARPAGDRRAGRQEGPLAGPPHCEADFVGARADRAG